MELSGESDCFSASCFGGLKMILIIKEYEGKEEDQLKQLLFSCFEDDMLLNIVNSSRLKFAYAAFIKEKLVGFMFAWMSRDRKSTRLNSSHVSISYAVFCLKKKIYEY